MNIYYKLLTKYIRKLIALPENNGGTLLTKIVRVNKSLIKNIMSMMIELLTNNKVKSSRNTIMRTRNKTPIALEVATEILITILVPLLFQSPNSMAMLMLQSSNSNYN